MDDYIPDFILYISRTSIMLRSEFTKPVLAMDVLLWWENHNIALNIPLLCFVQRCVFKKTDMAVAIRLATNVYNTLKELYLLS